MSEEEILAVLDDCLNNSLFKNTYKKQVIRELIRRYNKQKEKIQSLERQLDFIGEQNKYIDKLETQFYKQKEANKSIVYNFEKLVDKYEELSDKYYKLLGELNNE